MSFCVPDCDQLLYDQLQLMTDYEPAASTSAHHQLVSLHDSAAYNYIDYERLGAVAGGKAKPKPSCCETVDSGYVVPDDSNIAAEFCWEDAAEQYAQRLPPRRQHHHLLPPHKQFDSWKSACPANSAAASDSVNNINPNSKPMPMPITPVSSITRATRTTRTTSSTEEEEEDVDDMIAWLQYPPNIDDNDNVMQMNHQLLLNGLADDELRHPNSASPIRNHTAVPYLQSPSFHKIDADKLASAGRQSHAAADYYIRTQQQRHQINNDPIAVGSTVQFPAALLAAASITHQINDPDVLIGSSQTQLLEEMLLSSQAESAAIPANKQLVSIYKASSSSCENQNNLPSKLTTTDQAAHQANVSCRRRIYCSDDCIVPGSCGSGTEQMEIFSVSSNQTSPKESNSQHYYSASSCAVDISSNCQQLENSTTSLSCRVPVKYGSTECMSAISSVEVCNAEADVVSATKQGVGGDSSNGGSIMSSSSLTRLEDRHQNLVPVTIHVDASFAHKLGDCKKRKDEDERPPAHHVRHTTTKRSRAAEAHNKSERRRRERINENLKALQELIPYSNKTDKASMLGEAIEYLKELHSQIMSMSYATGIIIPSNPHSNNYLYPHTRVHKNGTAFECVTDQGAALSACSMLRSVPLRPMIYPSSLHPDPGWTDAVIGNGANVYQLGMVRQHPFFVGTNDLSEPGVVPSQTSSSYHQQFSQANIQQMHNV